MSDKMRWRYGDTSPVVAAVDAATVMEIGDLVYLESDDVRPASSQNDLGSKPNNQEMFAHKFLGVAMQRSLAGETSPVRVATRGVFEFVCPSSQFELGDFVGVDENAAGDALSNQQLLKVTASRYAIGRVARREVVNTTSVLVDICSTVMCGGVEGGSRSGV
jgi:hypothetical protein